MTDVLEYPDILQEVRGAMVSCVILKIISSQLTGARMSDNTSFQPQHICYVSMPLILTVVDLLIVRYLLCSSAYNVIRCVY